jgi:acyl dehydratase
MAIQPDRLVGYRLPDIAQTYAPRDAILYALGVGLGHDPCAREDLKFLIEDGLEVVPTFAVTLASPGIWIRAPEFGVDFDRLVHAEQAAWFHAPLPTEADVIGSAKVVSLTDRGPGRGAVLALEREIRDVRTGRTYCTLRQTLLLRGDWGFGGPAAPSPPSIIPERPPDLSARAIVDPRAALIYRLSGDRNPLHADPDFARRAGYERPILHGLTSYALAGVRVARACGFSPTKITALASRFSGAVFPGDILDFRVWRDKGKATFQAFVGDRKVLDQGQVAFGGDQ